MDRTGMGRAYTTVSWRITDVPYRPGRPPGNLAEPRRARLGRTVATVPAFN